MSDVSLIAADIDAIELSADPATFVMLACERAKGWLTQAIEHGDIDQIVELKSQAEAIRIYTIQKQLGMDAELAAAEIVRRAERGLGLILERGKADGTVKTPADGGWPAQGYPVQTAPGISKISPREVFDGNTHLRSDTYAVTEGVTDEQFDEAIDEAKAERNLSRANVVRKVTRKKIVSAPDVPAGYSLDRSPEGVAARVDRIRYLAGQGNNSQQIAEDVGVREDHVRELARLHDIALVDTLIGRTRRIDSNRIISEVVIALEGVAMGVELIDANDLDPKRVEDWATSLSTSLRSLNRLSKQLKEMSQ